MFICSCSRQVIQVIKVYLEFETKIDGSFDSKNQSVILMVTFCKETRLLLRNLSEKIKELSNL